MGRKAKLKKSRKLQRKHQIYYDEPARFAEEMLGIELKPYQKELLKIIRKREIIMSENCNHVKVYADYLLTSNPPQYPWICALCGTKGSDVGSSSHDIPSYSDVEKLFRENKLITNR